MSRWSVLLVPLLTVTMACQSLAPDRGGAAERSEELVRLKARVLELEREGRMLEVELARLQRLVAELEDRLEGTAAPRSVEMPPLPPPPAPDASAPPALPEKLGVDRVEGEDLELPVSAPAPRPEPTPDDEPAPGDAPTPDGAPTPVGDAGQALYDRGYTLYHQGSHVDAESAFQSFLQEYGESDLADNAQFWIGEARLKRDDLNGALAAFRETVDRFPSGNKVPDALFRTGDCLERLGDFDGARAAWRETIERYPNSAAAALSEERLAQVP